MKHLDKLYEIRSRIVHAGNIEISDEDLYYIRRYAKGALITVLSKRIFQKMQEESDFIQWLVN